MTDNQTKATQSTSLNRRSTKHSGMCTTRNPEHRRPRSRLRRQIIDDWLASEPALTTGTMGRRAMVAARATLSA